MPRVRHQRGIWIFLAQRPWTSLVAYPPRMDNRTLVGTGLMFVGGLLFGLMVGYGAVRVGPKLLAGIGGPEDVSSPTPATPPVPESEDGT